MPDVEVERAVGIECERHVAAHCKAIKRVADLKPGSIVEGDRPERIDRRRGEPKRGIVPELTSSGISASLSESQQFAGKIATSASHATFAAHVDARTKGYL